MKKLILAAMLISSASVSAAQWEVTSSTDVAHDISFGIAGATITRDDDVWDTVTKTELTCHTDNFQDIARFARDEFPSYIVSRDVRNKDERRNRVRITRTKGISHYVLATCERRQIVLKAKDNYK